MSPPWDEKSVFLAALALPPEDREAFLLGACPSDEARRRIRTLLNTLEDGQTASEAPAAPDSAGEGPTPSSDANTPAHSATTASVDAGAPLHPSDPRVIDEFAVLRRLGQGGMGIVYLAQDTLLQRPVAIKVLAGHLTGSEQALGRFRDEAKTAAALKNPGIVPVYKFGFDGSRHYIVSEYVAGLNLKELIAQEAARRSKTETTGPHKKSWRLRVAQMTAQLAEALEHSHRANVVHRDVKPSNVLIDAAGQPRLTDFGIAKQLAPEASMEATEGVGSCHYMSPEQAAIAGSHVDRRSDIFSLGVVLYEALALRKPFEGESPEAVLNAVRTQDPPPLHTIDPQVPRDLETICLKALEKPPERRYQSALHMAADLRSFLDGNPIMARPVGPLRRTYRWAFKHRVAFTVGVILLLSGGMGVSTWMHARASSAALGWLTVDSDVPGLTVLIQPFDPASLALLPVTSASGTTPMRGCKLPRGQYRVTVSSPDALSFAEFDARLFPPGEENHLTLLALSEQATSGTAPSSPAATGRVLRGRLIPNSTLTSDGMVKIPAGEYEFGWMDEPGEPASRRTLTLPAFYLDRTLVSNGEFKSFVDATGYPMPKYWAASGYDAALADRPIVCATAEDAAAYAAWMGKRLPTAPEWQAAARGPDKRLYPWGNDPDTTRCPDPTPADVFENQSWSSEKLYTLYAKYTRPTHALDGLDHPLGLLQMFGPLREITSSLEPGQKEMLLVGRGWREVGSGTDMRRVFAYPLHFYAFDHGFRCAKSETPGTTPAAGSHKDTSP